MEKKSKIKTYVDEFVALKQEETAIKEKLEQYKAFFELQATDDLHDEKRKTVTYFGNGNNSVSVTNAQKVTVASPEILKVTFGKNYKILLSESYNYDIEKTYKNHLGMILTDNMLDGTLDELISSATDDSKTQTLLKKKLKGDFKKDTKNIVNILGTTEQEALDMAYLVNELVAYDTFSQMLLALGYKGDKSKALEILQSAIAVKESYKISCAN